MDEQQREFLNSHRLCVVGVERRAGPPSLTPVYYIMDGDDLLISTTASRAKAKLIRRNPAVSVCVLGEQPPFPYLTVFGRGRIEEEGAADLMARVGEAISGRALTPEGRAALDERAQREGRVVLRVTPERFISTAPRAQQRSG
jgi:PPOX class probable F420-dependent enzyme